MDLKWCKYGNKFILLLDLGVHNGKMCCLKADMLDEPQIRIIRANRDRLNGLNTKQAVEWFNNNLPSVMSSYRTIPANQIMIFNTYDIKDLRKKDDRSHD